MVDIKECWWKLAFVTAFPQIIRVSKIQKKREDRHTKPDTMRIIYIIKWRCKINQLMFLLVIPFVSMKTIASDVFSQSSLSDSDTRYNQTYQNSPPTPSKCDINHQFQLLFQNSIRILKPSEQANNHRVINRNHCATFYRIIRYYTQRNSFAAGNN